MKTKANLSGPQPVELRRYPNRRYYDRTRSQHLTLEQIYHLVCDGYEVSVSDSKTGEDITAKVLAQLIIEHDPPKLAAFPAGLLHQIIRSNESLLRDFVEKYFSRALSAYLASQKEFDRYLEQAFGLSDMPTMGREWTRMMMGPFVRAFVSNGDGANAVNGDTAPKPDPVPAGQPPDAEGDLRQTVEELKRQLAACARR
jgi:polyhydroxyalkanoate synthesis repressor PhaR